MSVRVISVWTARPIGVRRPPTRDDATVSISEAESLLTSMLDHAGVRPGQAGGADVLATVEVFRRFAAVPVEDAASSDDDGDGVLAEFGTFDFYGTPEFLAGLARQFIEADDEVVMWQLRCKFHRTPGAVTEALGSGNLWSCSMPLDDFFAEALPFPAGHGHCPVCKPPTTSRSNSSRSERVAGR
ncbi:hypothetical protein [Dactylosporangium sp. NPDC051541]|uniref:hypothetical protein n=1 Tax=Dactylosporangium sp. NPDC051541 TaxID=3363977 RepID=UPI00379F06E4